MYNSPTATISDENMTAFETHPDSFMQRCGNADIGGVRAAIRVEGVMEGKSSTVDQKLGMENALKIGIAGGGIAAQTSVTQAFSNLQKISNNSCSFYLFSKGGLVENGVDLSGDSQKFIASAVDFVLKSGPEKAVPAEITLKPYSTVGTNSFIYNVYPKLDTFKFQASLLKMTKNTWIGIFNV